MTDQTLQILLFIGNLLIAGVVGFIGASIRIGEYKNKVDTLENTVGHDEHCGLRKTVGDVRDKVIACETSLKEREPLTKKKSPISLTERGQTLLEASGGKAFIDTNLPLLSGKIDAKEAKTAYDIQEVSKAVLQEMTTDNLFVPLKEYLFKEGLEIEDLIIVMGIYLRDKVLAQKGILPEDVDKTDPKNAK
ncbi:MAG: hypothetical protein AAB592_04360 [Patescibacteria group bacterium]